MPPTKGPPELKTPLPETPLGEMEIGDWFEIKLRRKEQYNTLLKRIHRFKTANPGAEFRIQSQGKTSEYPLRVHVFRVAPAHNPPTVKIIRHGTS